MMLLHRNRIHRNTIGSVYECDRRDVILVGICAAAQNSLPNEVLDGLANISMTQLHIKCLPAQSAPAPARPLAPQGSPRTVVRRSAAGVNSQDAARVFY